MSEFLSSPQASDYLPTISPTQAPWTPQELQTLHVGLTQFPTDQYDNVTRYIKIAATLPRKCVRDVAYKVKALGYTGGHLVATKRMKIKPYKDPLHPSAELLETRLAALLQDNVLALNTMRTNLLNGKVHDRAQMRNFRTNCDTVLSALGDICTSIPPLPLQLDTSLLENEQEEYNTKTS